MGEWDAFFNINTVIAILFLVVLAYIVGRALLVPVKYLLKLLAMSVWGVVLVLVMNFAGQYFFVAIPFNPFTVLLAGYLGLPWSLILVGLPHLLR
ncbi:MAG: pro-sigmaK processing inhibitor BofA family protein [Firmicutes bacterium]|nr:pro-sigmaK processing inhibitor BofA family protein [Dethiobacter sp.]MBS3888316.1 pro-sigmaK processing inhibitor BofA family protein [Bacillota bacterium]